MLQPTLAKMGTTSFTNELVIGEAKFAILMGMDVFSLPTETDNAALPSNFGVATPSAEMAAILGFETVNLADEVTSAREPSLLTAVTRTRCIAAELFNWILLGRTSMRTKADVDEEFSRVCAVDTEIKAAIRGVMAATRQTNFLDTLGRVNCSLHIYSFITKLLLVMIPTGLKMLHII